PNRGSSADYTGKLEKVVEADELRPAEDAACPRAPPDRADDRQQQEDDEANEHRAEKHPAHQLATQPRPARKPPMLGGRQSQSPCRTGRVPCCGSLRHDRLAMSAAAKSSSQSPTSCFTIFSTLATASCAVSLPE